MTWNVLFGGQDRMDRILDLLAARRPDLLVLQECLGWEHTGRLEDVALATGALDGPRPLAAPGPLAGVAQALPAVAQALPGRGPPRAVLGEARPRGSGSRYHVAIVSRAPLRDVRVHADPAVLGHCVVEAKLDALGGELLVLGTHLDAHHEALRVKEAEFLAGRLPAATLATTPALLLGDLNSLSRRDPYPADLADRLRAARIEKYGQPPRFDVLDRLEGAGWVDALWARPAPPAAWVTAVRARGEVRARTDYILASPPLAARLVDCEVVAVGGASDHEAVLATFA